MFSYFVVFAEMRTGSNFLEANLNSFGDLECHGEAFNPHFIGHQKTTELFGIDMSAREADPVSLLSAMKAETKGIPGFRFFNDHDPRVLRHVLDDPACAKIILTRNPLDSYVSLKIAAQTGQWKLSDMKQRKGATISFDAEEFQSHLAAKQVFQQDILKALQTSGQTAFYVAYEDIQDIDVLNGLARWIGSADQLDALSKSTKKQNPSPLEEKVSNFDEMQKALASFDHFNLGRTPNFEPRRGPGVPGFVLSQDAPLLYIPIHPTPADDISAWVETLGPRGTVSNLSQRQLRAWMKDTRRRRVFTVLSHPLERAYATFCQHILPDEDERFSTPRRVMRNRYGVRLPNEKQRSSYGLDDHREAFTQFLGFVKGNLAGQTSIRIDPVWASQSSLLEAAASVILPDIVVRPDEVETALAAVAKDVGLKVKAPKLAAVTEPFSLKDVYTEKLENLCFSAYRKDYINFGFEPWSG